VVEQTGIACAASGKAGGFLAKVSSLKISTALSRCTVVVKTWCDDSAQGPLTRLSFSLHAKLSKKLQVKQKMDINSLYKYN